MPMLRVHPRVKREGLQTHARAVRLPEPMKTAELEYLDIRDWYVNLLARKAQFEEMLAQSKRAGNQEDQRIAANKLTGIDGQLGEMRATVRWTGIGAYAVAFQFAAEHMLPNDISKAIREEAEKILGRSSSEFPV